MFTAKDASSIPGQGTKIPQAVQCRQNNNNNNNNNKAESGTSQVV